MSLIWTVHLTYYFVKPIINPRYICISVVLNTAPNEHDLIDLLADISDMWYQIGTALRISSKYLRGLLHREQDNTVKLSQVINTWLNTHPSSITWKTLIAAIEGNIVNNKAMGIKIRQRLGLSVDCEPS